MADPTTLAWYAVHARERAERYERADMAALHARLRAACPAGGRALDVGCGSGRDVAFLVAEGRDAIGVDPSPAMLAEARRCHPGIADRLRADELPALKSVAGERFDLVAATAVLVHVEPGELRAAVDRLAALVAPGGALVCSIPEPSTAPDAETARPGFALHAPAEVRRLAGRAGLVCTEDQVEPDGAGRRRTWRCFTFRCASTRRR